MAVKFSDLPAHLQKQVTRKLNEAGGKKGGFVPLAPEPKQNKLRAEKCGKYASQKEARRAWELKMLERAGKISNLREQAKFVLVPAIYKEIPRVGKRGKSLKPKKVCVQRELSYIADFVYEKDGETIVEDVKGYKGGATYRVFANKKKQMREKYGLEVREV